MIKIENYLKYCDYRFSYRKKDMFRKQILLSGRTQSINNSFDRNTLMPKVCFSFRRKRSFKRTVKVLSGSNDSRVQNLIGKESPTFFGEQLVEKLKTVSSFKKQQEKRNMKNLQWVPMEYSLETYQRSNQDTSLTHKPAVFEGSWVQSGDLLTDCSSSVGGELALGQNLLIAYMPWEGYNFEDAILISERLVIDDLYTSVHIERYDIETYETKLGFEEITRNIPDLSEKEIENLDAFGIIKIGSWVEEGDILVGKITPINKKNISPYQKLLYTILEKPIRSIRDSSLRAPKGIKAKVIDIKYFLRKKTSLKETSKVGNKGLRSKPLAPFQIENKKQRISKKRVKKAFLKTLNKFFIQKERIQKNQNKKPFSSHRLSLLFPFAVFEKKTRLQIEKPRKQRRDSYYYSYRSFMSTNFLILSTSKKKKKQSIKGFQEKATLFPILNKKPQTNKKLKNMETIHIYLAEKRKIQVGDKMAGRHGNKGIISQILPIQDMPYLPDGTPIDMILNPLGVPSRMNVGQIYECLLGLAGKYLGEHYKIYSFDEKYGSEASRSFVFDKLYQARLKYNLDWLFNPNAPGKIRIYDGRTGDCFDQLVTVGQAYMLRLVHMVDDKIHMRSTGPYSLVTQQPLRGRSKQGGQRLGEMEVWALEGYGAAFTLLEMLTIKSDDMTGRMTLWSNFILNKEISIGTPESFKVLICELQALCIDIGLFRYSEPLYLNSNSISQKINSSETLSISMKEERLSFSLSQLSESQTKSQKSPWFLKTYLREIPSLMNLP